MANQKYVAGFLFRSNDDQVALVEKKTPKWQEGKLNGIGGKVEPGETEFAAMVREFREETGVEILDWSPVAILTVGDAEVHFFRSFGGSAASLSPLNDVGEYIGWFDWNQLVYGVALTPAGRRAQLIPNLRWLIPMAADRDLPFGEIKSGFSGK